MFYAGRWRTPEQVAHHRTTKREINARGNPRRVRMGVGGMNVYVGLAPTSEDAERIRAKIRQEAPRADTRAT